MGAVSGVSTTPGATAFTRTGANSAAAVRTSWTIAALVAA